MSVNPIGSEFRVNTFTAGSQRTFPQSPQAVAMDSDGDFVVTWSSYGQDGSGSGVYGQRYNATGQSVGSEFRANTTTSNYQLYSTVAMDSDGDFVVTWSSYGQDNSGWGVYAQRYNTDGQAVGSEFRVNTTTSSYQQYSTVAMDSDGDFVVTWSSYRQDGSGWGVYAQRYNTAGQAVGSELRVNTTTSSDQQSSSVAMDSDGDFVVTWSSFGQDGSGQGVYAQRYNTAGQPVGSEFKVNTTTTNNQQSSSVAIDADGDFVITWSSLAQDGSGWGVYAQRYNASGQPIGSEFQVNTTTSNDQQYSRVAMKADGGFVISWSSNRQGSAGSEVYARGYNSAGEPLGPEFQVNTFTSNNQQFSSVAMNAGGDLIVAWSSAGQDGSGDGVYAQRYQVNEAPKTSGINDVTVLEDAPNTAINLFAAFADDNDTDAKLTYTIVNNSNPDLFSTTTIDSVTGQLILDYASNANGAGNMTVRATDTEGLFVETTFGVTVTSVNDAPTVAQAIPDQSATEDSLFQFVLPTNAFKDVDVGDSLTYKATLSDGKPLPNWLKFDAAIGTFSGTPLNEDVDTLSVKVTATDKVGASVSDTFDLAIAQTPPSNPLVINGTSSADLLEGAAGDDTIKGYAGDDEIYGDAGNDHLVGNNGHDFLVGGTGFDKLSGGAGNDWFAYTSLSEAGDTITDFGKGSDVLYLEPLFTTLGYDTIDPIADGYMQLVQKGANTQVQIYQDDAPNGSPIFSTLVTLNNFSAANLILGSNLIV
jgi:Ca2+-binding RTX toxin-like protein